MLSKIWNDETNPRLAVFRELEKIDSEMDALSKRTIEEKINSISKAKGKTLYFETDFKHNCYVIYIDVGSEAVDGSMEEEKSTLLATLLSFLPMGNKGISKKSYVDKNHRTAIMYVNGAISIIP